MVDLNVGSAALGAAVAWGVTGALDKAAQDDSGGGGSETTTTTLAVDDTVNTDLEREVAKINDRQARNNPPANSIYGFVAEQINDLSDGGSTTIRIIPTPGHNLDVKRLEFTREDDHDYVFEIEGKTVSQGHLFDPEPPITVTKGNPVIAKVTNNSGTTTDIDFEAQLWGWPTEQGRGLR